MHEAKLTTFFNVLQCQRDALAKGVEIIKRTLDKYDVVDATNDDTLAFTE